MTLIQYISAKNLTLAAFADLIGVRPQSVHRYVRYGRIPEPDAMARIHAVTGGLVTPNDIYGLAVRPKSLRLRKAA